MRGKIKTLDKNNEKLKLKKIAKKQKLQERGITLVALVVTIIILLILAGVTLNIALSNNGLFNKTKKAAEDYKEAQNEEEDSLLEYEYEMAKLQGKISETETAGEYAMEKEIKEIYGQNIKIGDTVNYDPNIEETEENTYDGTWKVLGIEDGKILLISSEAVEWLSLSGVEGYKTAIESLDNICEKYGSNTGAEEARSLRVEDINRITGYDPKKADCNKGTLNEYGITIDCEIKENKIVYTGSNGITQEIEGNSFIKEDGTSIGNNESTSYTKNSYSYLVAWGYMDDEKLTKKDFEVKDERWMNVFGEFGKSDTWLANQMITFSDGQVLYQMRSLQCGQSGILLGYPCVVSGLTLFDGVGSRNDTQRKAVHPVVKLSNNVKFDYSEDDNVWTIEE